MEAVRSISNHDVANMLDDAMKVLFSKLDEAIDDVENDRAISEEELWEEHEKENNEEGFVMGNVEVTAKPSGILEAARDKYVQKNPMSMDEIDEEIHTLYSTLVLIYLPSVFLKIIEYHGYLDHWDD